MILTQAQKIIAIDRHRFRVICCGRRGGKTTLAIEEIKGKALGKPSRICYLATTYGQARDIAWELLKRELHPIILSANESRLEIKVRTQKDGESLIILRGWESVETLRGLAFDFLVIDEVAMMRNFWINWQEVLRPTLADTKGEVMFISTPSGFNHFYDLYNSELTDKDFKSFHFTSYDNPYIPVEEIETAKRQMSPDRFAQEFMADFRKSEGLVFKEFLRDKHLYTDLPPLPDAYFGIGTRYRNLVGVDWGYVNPAAVVEIPFDGENFYADDEWYKTHRTDAIVAEYVSKLKNIEAVYPDPENSGAIEELRQRQVNVREVKKFKGSVEAGNQMIRELLLAGRLKINQRCVNLITEFESYSYDDEKEDKNQPEKPIDKNNHAISALRYVIMMMYKVNKPTDPYDVALVRRMIEPEKNEGR